jgi:hypothetical protein
MISIRFVVDRNLEGLLAMFRRASLCPSCASHARVEAVCEPGSNFYGVSVSCACCLECRQMCGLRGNAGPRVFSIPRQPFTMAQYSGDD